MPFEDVDGTALDQLFLDEGLDGAKPFRLTREMRYVANSGEAFVAPVGMSTDLASVPFPLWGLLAPFGHQSRAAVIHDHGCDEADASQHGDATHPKNLAKAYATRRQIDYVFREALEESQVSRFRAWLMWAGVSLARYFAFRRFGGIALAVAMLGWWAGLVTRIVAVWRTPWPIAIAVLAAAAIGFALAARSDWNLVAFGLATIPVFVLMLVVAVLDLAVQLIIWAVSWLVRGTFRGANPAFRPTTRGPRLR